jgi:hypothetical protein
MRLVRRLHPYLLWRHLGLLGQQVLLGLLGLLDPLGLLGQRVLLGLPTLAPFVAAK